MSLSFELKLIWSVGSLPVPFFRPCYCCSPWLTVHSGQRTGAVPLTCRRAEVASTLGVREPASRQHNNHFSRKCTVTHTRLLEESRSSQRHNFQCQ